MLLMTSPPLVFRHVFIGICLSRCTHWLAAENSSGKSFHKFGGPGVVWWIMPSFNTPSLVRGKHTSTRHFREDRLPMWCDALRCTTTATNLWTRCVGMRKMYAWWTLLRIFISVVHSPFQHVPGYMVREGRGMSRAFSTYGESNGTHDYLFRRFIHTSCNMIHMFCHNQRKMVLFQTLQLQGQRTNIICQEERRNRVSAGPSLIKCYSWPTNKVCL